MGREMLVEQRYSDWQQLRNEQESARCVKSSEDGEFLKNTARIN